MSPMPFRANDQQTRFESSVISPIIDCSNDRDNVESVVTVVAFLIIFSRRERERGRKIATRCHQSFPERVKHQWLLFVDLSVFFLCRLRVFSPRFVYSLQIYQGNGHRWSLPFPARANTLSNDYMQIIEDRFFLSVSWLGIRQEEKWFAVDMSP